MTIKKFIDTLIPKRSIMTISAVNADGTVTVTNSAGSVRVIGTGTVNDKVYVQNGVVIAVAPNLTHYNIEV